MVMTNRATRVLLADDHPVFRAGLRSTLADEPDIAVVGEATTGDEAVALCREQQPDVLLLDLRMPGPPAAETVTDVRAHWPAIRIIIVTAFDDALHLRDLVRRGVAGYVLKDEAPVAVVAAVRTVARGGSWFSPTIAGRLAEWVSGCRSDVPDLTEREQQLLALLAQGWDVGHIAATLHLAEQTVRNYLSRLYTKLGVHSRANAIVWARDRGLGDS